MSGVAATLAGVKRWMNPNILSSTKNCTKAMPE